MALSAVLDSAVGVPMAVEVLRIWYTWPRNSTLAKKWTDTAISSMPFEWRTFPLQFSINIAPSPWVVSSHATNTQIAANQSKPILKVVAKLWRSAQPPRGTNECESHQSFTTEAYIVRGGGGGKPL
ncbi:hypothetical protein CAPTEDRAFT_212530 [Capitella teleta]|uniref:Uncharacterized protein n=1 Tax=Capitella teleta TaxID=283909 RepID=R7T761_CAPTE|nr:hypothetical protein CAPTEDRAFT_212530 [Capitella teleta]|eukprot:ELT89479.1 hypothetical protein CAPTEDRAFT_212530 [Capitella teleta]